MRIIHAIFRVTLLIYFSFTIISLISALPGILSTLDFMRAETQAFFGGLLFFITLWLILFRHRGAFWATLEHELTHALFALLFFKRIESINARRFKGGWIKIDGGNSIIALAPYIFPAFTVVLFLLGPLFKSRFELFIIFMIGYTLAFHLVGVLGETHLRQPDIQQSGTVFAIIVIAFFNISIICLLLIWLAGEPNIKNEILEIFFLNIYKYLQQLTNIVVSYVNFL